MFTVDPKWMDFLKESGPKTFAVAVALAIFLYLSVAEILPPLNPIVLSVVVLATLISAMLAIMSLLSAIHKFFPLNVWIVHYFNEGRFRRQIRDYIPFMTEDERKIIAYLLAHNQKTFTCNVDGGLANTLLARGIVVRMMQPGQVFDFDDMPVTIPDRYWKIFEAERDKFPYAEDGNEPYPWRKRW